MVRFTTNSSVSIEIPDDLNVVTTDNQPFPNRRAGSRERTQRESSLNDIFADLSLNDALKELDLELVEIIDFEAGKAARPTRGPRKRRSEPARISLEAENAVLLIEDDEGYKWLMPDISEAGSGLRRRPGGANIAFTLFFDDPGEGEAETQRGLKHFARFVGSTAKRIVGSARAFVLRFTVGAVVGAIGDHIDGNGPFGLFQVTGNDPAKWLPSQETRLTAINTQLTPRVLLFVHGTFSSTRSSFGDLARHHPDFHKWLNVYDAVLAFDHKTLGDSVEQNAMALGQALSEANLPPNLIIDGVGYSRGGLVLRHFVERHWPSPAMRHGRFVYVGSTLNGTLLASRKHWGDLLDLYTNTAAGAVQLAGSLIGAAPGAAAAAQIIKGLGGFAKLVVEAGTDDAVLPGLASMVPESPAIKTLHDGSYSEAKAYYSIGANFEPTAQHRGLKKGFLARIGNGVIDQLFKNTKNDLVVDTPSMTRIGASKNTTISDAQAFRFSDNAGVYHTVYFAQKQTINKLDEWLVKPAAEYRALEVLRKRPRRTRKLSLGDNPAMVSLGSAPSLENYESTDEGAIEPESVIETEIDANIDDPVRCSFEAKSPETISINKTAILTVNLTQGDIEIETTDTHAMGTGVVDQSEIDVRVIALQNVKVKSVSERSFKDQSVTRVQVPSAGHTTSIAFSIKGLSPGASQIIVQFEQAGTVVSSLQLSPVIVSNGSETVTTSSANFTAAVQDTPHLTLQIFEIYQGGELEIRFVASCNQPNINLMETVNVGRSSLADYFRDYNSRIESESSTRGFNYTRLMDSVRSNGTIFFEEFLPERIKNAIARNWDLFSGIQVISDNYVIPWELFYVSKRTSFFAEKGITRWPLNLNWGPTQLRLRSDRVRLLCPDYQSHANKLPGARLEVNALKNLHFPGSQEWKSDYDQLVSQLETGLDIDLFHIASHGSVEASKGVFSSDIWLSDRDFLPSEVVKARLKFSSGSRPIVFLNACQLAQSRKTLSWVNGFTNAFLNPYSGQGAGAVISPLWSIGDASASLFAREFYTSLSSGYTILEAIKSAQSHSDTSEDPTWLSYVVFANPLARVIDADLEVFEDRRLFENS